MYRQQTHLSTHCNYFHKEFRQWPCIFLESFYKAQGDGKKICNLIFGSYLKLEQRPLRKTSKPNKFS